MCGIQIKYKNIKKKLSLKYYRLCVFLTDFETTKEFFFCISYMCRPIPKLTNYQKLKCTGDIKTPFGETDLKISNITNK